MASVFSPGPFGMFLRPPSGLSPVPAPRLGRPPRGPGIPLGSGFRRPAVAMSSCPPASSTRRRTIASPRWPAWTARSAWAVSMPTPSSLISTTMPLSPRTNTSIRVGSACLTALTTSSRATGSERLGERVVVDRRVDGQGHGGRCRERLDGRAQGRLEAERAHAGRVEPEMIARVSAIGGPGGRRALAALPSPRPAASPSGAASGRRAASRRAGPVRAPRRSGPRTRRSRSEARLATSAARSSETGASPSRSSPCFSALADRASERNRDHEHDEQPSQQPRGPRLPIRARWPQRKRHSPPPTEGWEGSYFAHDAHAIGNCEPWLPSRHECQVCWSFDQQVEAAARVSA